MQELDGSGWWRVLLNGSIMATLINKEEARRYIWLQYKDKEDIDYISDADLEMVA